MSKVAVRSGKHEKFWELDEFWQCWLVAVYETEDEFEVVKSYVNNKEKEEKETK